MATKPRDRSGALLKMEAGIIGACDGTLFPFWEREIVSLSTSVLLIIRAL